VAGITGKYEGIDPRLLNILDGVSRELGIPLQVNSGYRPGDSGQHGSRLAADIQISHLPDEQKAALVRKAHELGATRFITYDTSGHLHIDLSEANGPFWPMHTPAGTGPKGGSNRHMGSAPQWYRDTVAQIQRAPTSDPRTASTDPTGAPAVSPYDLPGRGVATPGINPTVDPYQHMGGMHPMLEQVLEQRRAPTLADRLSAFGAGALNAQGGNWFGAGAAAVEDMLSRRPEELSALEVLQANNELFELDERRRQGQMARQQEQQRQAVLEGIVNDPSQPEWRRQQAQMELMGLRDVFEAPKWETRTSGQDIVRVNPETGDYEVLYQGQGDNAPKWYGGGQPVLMEGGRQGIAITNDQGQMEVLELPEGAELRGSPGYAGGVSGAQTRATNVENRYDELVNTTGQMLTQVNSGISSVSTLLNDIAEGRYSNTGAIRGRVATLLGDEANAVLQLKAVNEQLRNLQITNLAPVTEKELELMSALYASTTRTPEQNMAILRELQRSYQRKKEVLEQVRQKIRQGVPVYQIMLDAPDLYEPDTAMLNDGQRPSVPQPGSPEFEEAREEMLQ
jgi:hypothetical protein